MSFFMEYMRNKIAQHMMDTEERERQFEDRVRYAQAKAEKVKSFNNQPAKPWGFWKTPVKSAQYEMMSDPGVAKLPGRAKTTFY